MLLETATTLHTINAVLRSNSHVFLDQQHRNLGNRPPEVWQACGASHRNGISYLRRGKPHHLRQNEHALLVGLQACVWSSVCGL